jgi:type I restriction enzyme S subunit
MIEGLKPYAEYKESGHRWLGNIPAHWEMRKLKHLTRFINGLPFKPADWSDSGVAIIRIQNLNGSSHFNYTRRRDLPDALRIRPGELLFAWSGNRGTSFGPFLWNRSFDGYLNQHIFKLAGYSLETRYFAAILRVVTTHIEEEKTHGIIGLVHVTKPELSGTSVPVASTDEQAAIVRFLDHANRKIDGFIRAKRKLIGLLNEQKQAIIHRAVTRGLHPDVHLKPSGIPWLGDIPKHWELRRVKQVTRILRGKFSHRPRNDPSFYDGPYPFIQTGAVAQADKFITSYKQTLNDKGLSVSKLFPSGTLLMTIAANIGDVAILTFAACFPDSIVGFVPAGKLDRDYLYFVFRCMKGELLREAPVNTQGNLNVERIGIMWMPLPPLSEQEQITRYIENEMAPFDTAIARTEREIALMQEYRTRLTADLVTGKLDVREAAAHLPAPSADAAAEPTANEALEEIETEEIEA